MDSTKYVTEAVKTESLDTDAIQKRFTLGLQTLFGTMLAANNNMSESMDLVKKHLFYGKNVDLPGLTNTSPEYEIKKYDAGMDLNPKLIRLLHGVVGIITEAGEMTEQLYAHMYDKKELDEVNIAEEIGDLFWYCAIICDTVGISFESLMEKNIEKLRARYGDKFSSDKAINRDLDTERNILEKEH
ncbi:nucleoside triphosphate pyrophosphohydrolase family protein [bacterium]|nr:nucleoside triphosphate pyrophosphohydrolase family protein [bacterium]